MVNLGDQYVRKARVYPGLLAAAPVATLIAFAGDVPPLASIVSSAAFIGLFYLMAELTRSAGKRYEIRVLAASGGFPTTAALRLTCPGPKSLRDRRRQQVEAVTGIPLPTMRQERADPSGADAEYLRGVKAVIARARRDGWYKPLLESENTSYAFRRNLRALKPFALILLATCVAVAVGVAAITGAWMVATFVLGVAVVAALLWIILVRDVWVEEQSTIFADELFVTLQSMSAPVAKSD